MAARRRARNSRSFELPRRVGDFSLAVSRTLFVILLAGLFAPLSRAQDKNPYAGDPKYAQLGEFQFRLNCAFCHGLGAKGGGRGPDLTRAQKRHGKTDADLFHTINDGIPGTAMPPNGSTGQGVGMTGEEIWQVITYIRSVEVKAPARALGDAGHGKQLFFGSAACSTCHMVEGKGGRMGPDLTATASARATDYLIESVRNPSRRLAQGVFEAMKEFPQEYESVKVETAGGEKFTGVVINEDSFTLQMLDQREQLHLFEKSQLRSFEKSRESLMPVYNEKLLPDKDLNDILAFLQSVRAN